MKLKVLSGAAMRLREGARVRRDPAKPATYRRSFSTALLATSAFVGVAAISQAAYAQTVSVSSSPTTWRNAATGAGHSVLTTTSNYVVTGSRNFGSSSFTVTFAAPVYGFMFDAQGWGTCCTPSAISYSLDGGPIQVLGTRNSDPYNPAYLGILSATTFTSVTIYGPDTGDAISSFLPFEYAVTDGTPPTLTINGPVATQTGDFTVNFNFSETVVGFTQSDVVVTNGSIAAGLSGSGASYSLTITPAADGLVSVSVAAARYEDAAGNENTAASTFSVQADVSSPTVSVTGPAGPVNVPFTANFAFSENVSNFSLGDIAVVNGTASAFAGSGANYSATITPTASGPVQVSLANGVANDGAGNGNQASNAFSVVADLTAPIVTVPGNITIGTDAGVNTAVVAYSVSAADPGNGALTPVRTAGLASGAAFPLGTTLVTYQATDAAGNVGSASFSVTVSDDENPTLVGTPGNITTNTDAGLATAIVSWTPPTVSDNVTGATVTRIAGPAPGSAFPIGITTVTYRATDAAGNTSTSSFTVTVSDNERPIVAGSPGNILTSTDAGLATAVVSWTEPTPNDNAPGSTISRIAGPAPGSAFPIGVTTITYEAEDAAGNTSQASFTVTVEDNEDPVIVNLPADIAINTDAGQPTAVVSWTAPTVTDNAPGTTITQTAGPAPGSAFPIGVTTITYQAEDAAGNIVSESFDIAVADAEPPAFTGFPNSIAITVDYPTTSATATWTPPGVSDNAPGASVTRIAGPAPGSTFPLGVTIVTYRVQDGAGNVFDQSFTVTVAQTPPGSVRLVVQSGADGAFAFSSPEPDLNFTIDTINGDGEQIVTIRPGAFNLAFVLPAGFGILSAECDDSNSTLNSDAQNGTINIASGENITCTIVTVDTLNETSRLIGAFLGARTQLILQNMPDSDRRIDRLNGRGPSTSGVSAFGLNIGRGDLPFELSLDQGRANFSFSLAGMRAQNQGNRENARLARARWGDGDYEAGRTALAQGYDFAGFGGADADGSALDPSRIGTAFRDGVIRGANPGSAERPRANAQGDLPGDAGDQRFDVWVEGAYAQFDTDIGDGDFYMLSLGADWVTNPDLLLGLAVQVDWTDMTGTIAGSSIDGVGVLAGPYITARLSEGLYFDAHAALGISNNQVSPFGVYEDEVDAERAYLSAALIGDIRNGNWTFRPEGRISYFREETEAYTDSLNVAIPSLEVETGTFSLSPELSYRYTFSDQSTLAPFVSLEATWIFSQENAAAFALGNSPFVDETLRGRAEAGLTFEQAGGMNLRATGFFDGIGQEEFSSWGGQLRLSWSFDPK